MTPTDYAGNRAISQCILPTGECFTDALELLTMLLTEREIPPEQIRLVHGICLLEEDNTPFAHAWVEVENSCLFVGLYKGERVICTVPRKDYYQRLRVQDRTKYTPWQAAHENTRTVSYGPWKQRYLVLTRTPMEKGEGNGTDA